MLIHPDPHDDASGELDGDPRLGRLSWRPESPRVWAGSPGSDRRRSRRLDRHEPLGGLRKRSADTLLRRPFLGVLAPPDGDVLVVQGAKATCIAQSLTWLIRSSMEAHGRDRDDDHKGR